MVGETALVEISSEYDPEFARRGVCVVYIDGVEVAAYKTFKEAMHAVFPGYELWDETPSYDAQLDNKEL